MNIKNYSIHQKKYKLFFDSLHAFYRLTNSNLSISGLIIHITKLIAEAMNASLCLVIILDNHKTSSLLRCSISKRRVFLLDKKRKIVNRIEKYIINTTSAVLNSHILGAPIIAEDVIGIIIVRRKPNQPSFDKLEQKFFITLTEQTMIAIKNIQLHEEQQKIILGSIKSFINLLDNRLSKEYAHSPYFSRLVTAIAKQMKLNENQTKALQYASVLHDAGKLDIPLEILNKPTKLTKNEFRIIKRHPIRGAQLIKHMKILKPVIPIILYHHERYDGKGYPSRLKGEKIPLGARIMALADAFEAMIYGRPYRQRMNIEAAIEEIKKKSGTQFDPKVVEGFLKAIKFTRIKKYLQLIK
ncbi:MAG: HD domain-containing protein [Candidatus Omnitrophica bacterium]|nr:HD domain-containing protein [Candidatus Omnitrophota bacterium]